MSPHLKNGIGYPSPNIRFDFCRKQASEYITGDSFQFAWELGYDCYENIYFRYENYEHYFRSRNTTYRYKEQYSLNFAKPTSKKILFIKFR